MKVKLIKFDSEQVIKKNSSADVGYDIIADEDIYLYPKHSICLEIPVVIEFDSEDLFYMVFPRSSYAKKGLSLANTIGLIDRSYQGKDDKIKVVLERRKAYNRVVMQKVYKDMDEAYNDLLFPEWNYNHLISVGDETHYLCQKVVGESREPLIIKKGESIAQLVFVREALIEMVEVMSEEHKFKKSRGGFGTTNK